MHSYNEHRGYKHYAFEAIQVAPSGTEILLTTVRVTKKRNADQAYAQAEAVCERARNLSFKPAAFVREINAPGEAKLPPDPDGKNDDRASWAGAALDAYMAVTGSDKQDAVSDLITDLMHWCDRNGICADSEILRAINYYGDETEAFEEERVG